MSFLEAAQPGRTTEIVADVVHERLRDAIFSAELRPNHRLVEEELAAALKVSRTPVREALLRLRQEGLVIQNKGWVVKDHTPREILEFIEARGGIEAAAARLAATRITSEELTELERLANEMEDPGASRQTINQLNNEFHQLITDAGRNNILMQFAKRTKINYWNFNTPVVFTPADDAIVNSEHRQLIEALRAGDEDLCEKTVREHIAHTARIIATALGLES